MNAYAAAHRKGLHVVAGRNPGVEAASQCPHACITRSISNRAAWAAPASLGQVQKTMTSCPGEGGVLKFRGIDRSSTGTAPGMVLGSSVRATEGRTSTIIGCAPELTSACSS